MAEVVGELWQLVKDYGKQETIDPLKTLGRFVGYGAPGSILLGFGVSAVRSELLRALQIPTGTIGQSPHRQPDAGCRTPSRSSSTAAARRRSRSRRSRRTAKKQQGRATPNAIASERSTMTGPANDRRQDHPRRPRGEVRGAAGRRERAGRGGQDHGRHDRRGRWRWWSSLGVFLFGKRRGRKKTTVVEVRRF